MDAQGVGSQLRVAFVAPEAVPFAKTGGLADVAGALPRALDRLGHRPALFLPLYRQARRAGVPIEPTNLNVVVPVGLERVEGSVCRSELPGSGVPVYLIDQPGFFDRPYLYGSDGRDDPDNAARFVFFQRAVLEVLRAIGFRPDIVHGHDWQAGLLPVYLREIHADDPGLGRAATVQTIHNLAYQGTFPPEQFPLTGLDWRLYNWRQLEAYGRVNFLKAGLAFADMLSTVSPTYAREIQSREGGWGLDGILRERGERLRGIVNGVDPAAWDPRTDRLLSLRYDEDTFLEGKMWCKGRVQHLAGLAERPEIPLFAAIGRLDHIKGWDLILEAADDLLSRDVQFVILGEGHPHYHRALDELAARHPGKLRVFLEFSDAMAHRIEAGADVFLMPSLSEPCGLNQLYSQIYGTVPIVRATGGLADTVVDATPENLAAGTATGFLFREPRGRALAAAIDRALALWPDRDAWYRLMRAGMRADWSWDRGAHAYVELYRDAIRAARARDDAGASPPCRS